MYRATLYAILLGLLQASNLRAQSPPAPAAQTPPPASHDWPGFLGPTRNGKSGEHGLPKEWPAQGPPLVWQATAGAGYSAPAIADGRLFQFSRVGNDARLACFEATTGKQLWSNDYATDFEDMLGYNNGPRAT